MLCVVGVLVVVVLAFSIPSIWHSGRHFTIEPGVSVSVRSMVDFCPGRLSNQYVGVPLGRVHESQADEVFGMRHDTFLHVCATPRRVVAVEVSGYDKSRWCWAVSSVFLNS